MGWETARQLSIFLCIASFDTDRLLALSSWQQNDSSTELQLLKRPRPLPKFKDEEKCIYAQWSINGFYYRKSRLPKIAIKGQARVQYATLYVTGGLPKFQIRIPLVSIGYIESQNDILDIRGCDYKILIFGVDNVQTIRDWLRFLVIRQRVPHSLVGKQFEWQVRPVKNDRQLKISRFSLLNCFRFV